MLAEVLAEATRSLQLQLDEGQQVKLVAYVDLLARWNRTYNLTAVREPLAMMTQHVVDCLAVVTPLKAHLGALGRSARLLDVGSGAGLPGMILGVALPQLEVVCIDSIGKKTAFIAQAAATLGLKNVHAVHARVEAFAAPSFDVIVSRALSSLPKFVANTEHLLAAGGKWLAMKGAVPQEELGNLDDRHPFHVEQISVPGLGATRCLVWIEADRESERTLSTVGAPA